jgi:hypothetical protein
MHVWWSLFGSRADIAPVEIQRRRAAELVAAQLDTVSVTARATDALVATGLISAGAWL